MTNTTNDIDALLDYLKLSQPDPRWADSLTALVAERNALKQRVAELEESTSILRWRVTTMLAEQRPADRDRDLRERLVCAALNGILSEQRGLLNHEYALRAIGLADATLAAMRKGEACNR